MWLNPRVGDLSNNRKLSLLTVKSTRDDRLGCRRCVMAAVTQARAGNEAMVGGRGGGEV